MALEVSPVKRLKRARTLSSLASLAGALLLAWPSNAQDPVAAKAAPAPTPPAALYPALPSETPAKFTPTFDGFEYVRNASSRSRCATASSCTR